jgi:hypothetical protein
MPGPVSETTMLAWSAPSSRQAIVVVLGGVGDQVDQDLGQPLPVGVDGQDRTGAVLDDPDRAFGGDRSHQLAGLLDDRADQDRLNREAQVTRFDPGDVDELVDQREQMAPGAEDSLKGVAVLVVLLGHLEELGEAEDGVERGPQLVARAGQERVLRLGGCHGLIPGRGQLFGPAGEQLFGPEMRLGEAADFVTRIGHGFKRPSLAQPARVLRVQADPPGDPRGEQGNAGQPGEQAQRETGGVEQFNPRLQRGDLVVRDGDQIVGLVGEAGDLAAQQVHRFSLVHQRRAEAPDARTVPDGRTQLRQLQQRLVHGSVQPLLLADGALHDGRFPQRPALRADPRQRQIVRVEENRIAGCRVAADTRFRVHHVEEKLVGCVSQGTRGGGDASFIAFIMLEQQVRRGDAHQGDQRQREHDQALRPQGPVEPPPPQPARPVRHGRR